MSGCELFMTKIVFFWISIIQTIEKLVHVLHSVENGVTKTIKVEIQVSPRGALECNLTGRCPFF